MWQRLRKVTCIVMVAVLYFWPFTFWIESILIKNAETENTMFMAYALSVVIVPSCLIIAVLIIYSIIIVPAIRILEYIFTGEVKENYNYYDEKGFTVGYLNVRPRIKRIIKKLKENSEERNI